MYKKKILVILIFLLSFLESMSIGSLAENYINKTISSNVTIECEKIIDSKTVEVIENQIILVNSKNTTNVTLEFVSNETLGNISINITESPCCFIPKSLAELKLTELKYVNITTSKSLNETNLKWVLIKIYYSDSELNDKGIDENSLGIYWYNETSNQWIKINTNLPFVFDNGLDVENNFIYSNISYFGIFGVAGLKANGQNCSVNEECSSGICYQGTCVSSIPTTTTTPISPITPVVTTIPPIVPKPTTAVDIIKWDILREVTPGKSVVEGIIIKNKLNTAIKDLHIEVSGIPLTWVTVVPSKIDLNPFESGGFTLGISVPSDASYGDYKVVITFKNSEVEDKTFFILRIKELLPYGVPLTSRIVELNKQANRTDISIIVSNPTNEAMNKVELIEEIPKVLANSIEELQFNTTPSKVIKKDPEVEWDIFDLLPNKSSVISYSINKILDEFTPYIYFPVKQVTLLRGIPSKFSIVNFDVPPAFPGSTTVITFTIQNLDLNSSHRFQFNLYTPLNWSVTPEKIDEIIKPNEIREFKLFLSVAKGVETGNYILRASFQWDDNLLVKEYIVKVYTLRAFSIMLYVLFGIIGFIILVCFIILLYKQHKRYKRKNVLEKIRKSFE